MPAPESRPSEKKIAALLIIAVVAAGIGLYSYSKESPGVNNIIDSITSRISLSGFSLRSQNDASIVIDADLSFDVPPAMSLSLQSPVRETTLVLSGQGKITLDRTEWQFPGETSIAFKNFTGKSVLGKETSVSGNALAVSINSASRSASNKGIPIQASGLALELVDFSGVSYVGIDLKNITGTVKADDGKNTALYTVSNNRLLVSGFSGDVQFFGDRVVLHGRGKLNAELLKNAK